MITERISNRQMILILIMNRTIIALSFLPVINTGTAAQDAWATTLVLGMGTALLGLVIAGLGVRFPDKTIIHYSQDLLGSWGGKLLSLIPLWLFLQMASTDLRLYGELIKTAFLPRTPLSFIISSMVLLSAICVYLGIEVLGRMADFLFLYFGLAVLATILIPLPEMLSFNFEPVLARGIEPVLSSAFTPIALGTQLVVVGMLLPSTTEPEKGVRSVLTAVVISSMIITVISIAVLGKLGPVHSHHATFPLLKTIRGIEASEFVERLEILAVLAWGLGLFVAVSTFLYCGAKGISQWFDLDDYRPLVGPMSIMWVVLSMHGYESVFEIRQFFAPEVLFPYFVGLLVVLYVPLWVAYLIRRLFGQLDDPGGGEP